MRIFLGSSTESVALMETVAAWIDQSGYTPLPWNQPGLILPGRDIYTELFALTRKVDGAIFIFGEDDEVWYRKEQFQQPRDNVLLEYGLFTGSLGMERAVICLSGTPKRPSDLVGLKYIDYGHPAVAKIELKTWLEYLASALDQKPQEDFTFGYVRNSNVLIDSGGMCWRVSEYRFTNRTRKPVNSYLVGETSHKPMTLDEMNIGAYDARGNPLETRFSVITDNYKRWDILFRQPIPPGGEGHFFVSYLSCDRGHYQGQHTRRVLSGVIEYLIPKNFCTAAVRLRLRDADGWHINPPGTSVRDYGSIWGISFVHGEVAGMFQLRIEWSEEAAA
jgi:hypothetical protein